MLSFFEKIKNILKPEYSPDTKKFLQQKALEHETRKNRVRIFLYSFFIFSDFLSENVVFENIVSGDYFLVVTVSVVTLLLLITGFVRNYKGFAQWWDGPLFFLLDIFFVVFIVWFYISRNLISGLSVREFALFITFLLAFLNLTNVIALNIPVIVVGSIISVVAAACINHMADQSIYIIIYGSFIVMLMGLLSAFLSYLMRENSVINLQLTYLNNELEKLAQTDPLTGLANRRAILGLIEREVLRMERVTGPFSLLILDVDHFKKVNDTYGHDRGDAVLLEVTRRLLGSVRKQDLIARWGGEEFLVFMPETDIDGAAIKGESLRKVIADSAFVFDDVSLSVTISGGAVQHTLERRIEESIQYADELLYRAKEQGRNRVLSS